IHAGARDRAPDRTDLGGEIVTVKDLYWAAGFIEGEGTFGFTHSPRVSVGQVQREPLERLQRMFGGSIRLDGRKHPINVWGVYGSRAAGLMMTLYPLMSTRRKGRIFEVLTVWRTRFLRNGRGAHCRRGHEWTEENTYRPPNGRRKFCRSCTEFRKKEKYALSQ
ncbi:MAG: hypothetical protein KGH87_09890, partial [Thaumarchaeota archaeon]|nr:hypothetical protein [Nitrososphaerota archaeon]